MTYSSRCSYILCKDNTLRLDDEEVDKFVEVTGKRVKSLLWYGIVLSWANLGNKTAVEQSLSRCLRKNREEQSYVCSLERISQDIKVSGCKDEEDDGSVGNARGSWVVP